jgi:hypothetical protein
LQIFLLWVLPCPTVCSLTCSNTRNTGWNFMKFDSRQFYKKFIIT